MESRRRSPLTVQEEILLETNFDDESGSPRTRENKVYRLRNSDLSLDRYSDGSLRRGSCCQACLTRIPYATLIATVMCLLGVGVFCGTMYRGATLAVLMADQVFHQRLMWLEAVQMVFVVLGASMAALGFIILFVGFLATGATRHKVYRAWGSRVGGRISCAVFMGVTYILQLAWILMFGFLVIVTFIFTMFWHMCYNYSTQIRECIDLTQFDFMFPNGTRVEDMKVCGPTEIKLFCKDSVEKAEMMFILATAACMLVILSLIHYLMCLSANYAHIRDHEKFQELQELHCLNDPDYLSTAASKDRF
ncbi:proteolipid protein DM gamma-like isoform X2 [Ctenocephalides felis]|uniref:proteolipid protein DM gamma-like isoform X2 n=1 Tax=Ctenocephalides felis TaxID=7515 RepID=UPI000E6E4732|nr:proteolipid protein DM gamma-like isoform X2 [Ctenocephalides felis]XP_026478540.1 proteolipid protein DM gamma-like isoform X2 [Ctenocephalides felis]